LPMAVYCVVDPFVMIADSGVTEMDSSATGVTNNVVESDTPPKVALMEVVPAFTEVASPFEPAELLTVAAPVLEELQATDDVRSWTVASENVPVAVNCLVLPSAMLGLSGVTVKVFSIAAVTVSVAGPDVTLLKDDVIEAVPTPTAVANP